MDSRSNTQWQQVAWTLPKPLYDLLADLQGKLLDPNTRAPRWGSVEELATHFLRVAVRAAHQELATKAQQSRLVRLPGEAWP